MIAATSGERIALQPETRYEEHLLMHLFSEIEPPACWFTLDVPEYDALDHALARERAQSSESVPFAPGERALVVSTPRLDVETPGPKNSSEGNL
jgi:hypothetical protein